MPVYEWECSICKQVKIDKDGKFSDPSSREDICVPCSEENEQEIKTLHNRILSAGTSFVFNMRRTSV